MKSNFEILVKALNSAPDKFPSDSDPVNWQPAADVYELGGKLVVQLVIAGIDPSMIVIQTHGMNLYIYGLRPDQAHVGSRHYSIMEIDVGPFSIIIELPNSVDPQSAKAKYENGFLFVTFKKKQDKG